MNRSNFRTRSELIQDLMRYPELRFLDRFDVVPPIALAVLLYVQLQAYLNRI
jgi:stearoyl-CoA desaturase (delta-9 desaturase)